MKKIIASVFFAGIVLMAHAQKEIVNDANAEVRTISGSFNSIKISGGINLFLTQSDEEAVAVSAADDKFKEGIKTVVEDNILKIYYFGERSWNNFKNKNLRVYVSFKELQKLDASSACDIQVAGSIKVSSLTLSLSGASDFKGAVNVGELKIGASGASDVTIKGIAASVRIETTGASDVKGYDLVTELCTASASGASDINITVNKEIKASASGASDISYKGSAEIKESHASGASSVSKKG
jgi:Putative auto-transporter adhesin, head GIN domain